MALTWSLGAIKNWKELKDEYVVTDMMIYLTMFVGINRITEENWKEFFTRVSFTEKLFGAFLLADGKPQFITEAQVKRRIGLFTNASILTWTQFLKRQVKRFRAEAVVEEVVEDSDSKTDDPFDVDDPAPM